MHKRIIIYIILITAILFGALGCQKEDILPTQEEFQAEYIDMLNAMGLHVHPDDDEPLFSDSPPNKIWEARLRLADGIEIYEDILKVKLHVYTLVTKDQGVPSVEEMADLYHQYDEDVYQRFYKCYVWYAEVGSFDYRQYDDALSIVHWDYRHDHGENFNNTEWDDMTAEDVFELENYIKENPNFKKTNRAYNNLLYWLGIENPEVTPTPK